MIFMSSCTSSCLSFCYSLWLSLSQNLVSNLISNYDFFFPVYSCFPSIYRRPFNISFRIRFVLLVVYSLIHVWLFSTPWTTAHQLFPVLHYVLELAQTHVHWVTDAIQSSHPVTPFTSCPQSFPTSGPFPISIDMFFYFLLVWEILYSAFYWKR